MADISKLTLPINGTATTYNIADSVARSSFTLLDSTVQSLQDTTFLTYKDNTHTESQIKALTSAKVGDFYLASDTGTAWVCTKTISGTVSDASWEKAGSSADVSAFVTAVDAGAITDTVPQTFEGHQVSEFVLKTDVVNNLTSTATNVPLSAAQGKILSDKITTVSSSAATTESVEAVQQVVSNHDSSINSLSSEVTSLTNDKLNKSGGTMTGTLVAQNNTSYTTKQVRNIIVSTSSPSGGSSGDIWIKYTS